MTPDPKLVEAVARALCASDGLTWEKLLGAMADHPLITEYRKHARAALAAISASGEWWIAPWEATDAMIEVGHMQCRRDASFSMDMAEKCFAEMRDAHLKDTGTGK